MRDGRASLPTSAELDELPDLNPPQYGDVRDSARPILSFSWHKEGAHRAPQ